MKKRKLTLKKVTSFVMTIALLLCVNVIPVSAAANPGGGASTNGYVTPWNSPVTVSSGRTHVSNGVFVRDNSTIHLDLNIISKATVTADDMHLNVALCKVSDGSMVEHVRYTQPGNYSYDFYLSSGALTTYRFLRGDYPHTKLITK